MQPQNVIMPELPWISSQQLDNCIVELLGSAHKAKEEASQNVIKNVPDPFAILCLGSIHTFQSTDEIRDLQHSQSTIQAVSTAVGHFHKQVLSHVPGLDDHDEAEYDIFCDEKKIMAKIVNKHNTMDSKMRRHVISDLKGAVAEKPGYKGYLVIIIPKRPMETQKTLCEGVEQICGAAFYELVTGDPDALFNLFSVLELKLRDKNPVLADYCLELFRAGIAELPSERLI